MAESGFRWLRLSRLIGEHADQETRLASIRHIEHSESECPEEVTIAEPLFPDSAAARAALREVVAERGAEILSAPATLASLLADLVPEDPRAAWILVTAAEHRVADRLRERVRQGTDIDVAARLTASSFAEATMLTPNVCAWAVGAFAEAAGWTTSARPPTIIATSDSHDGAGHDAQGLVAALAEVNALRRAAEMEIELMKVSARGEAEQIVAAAQRQAQGIINRAQAILNEVQRRQAEIGTARRAAEVPSRAMRSPDGPSPRADTGMRRGLGRPRPEPEPAPALKPVKPPRGKRPSKR